MSQLAANIESVDQRIQAAAQRAGRKAEEITLVAVTKTHPLDTVMAAYRAGLRHFGENRVEEGCEKVAGMANWLAGAAPDDTGSPPVWHLIGHLQSRKVGQALGQFALIHSVDSLKLAQRLNRLAERDNYPPTEILLECNVSGEAAKSGFTLDRWLTDRTQLNAFLEAVVQMATLDKITIRGLMTMAPLTSDPEEARPVFKSLAALRVTLQQELSQFDWSHLSMGMTDDFEVAIEEGATIIRVGRALFGERNV
jgi:pyridoxal phosphate enzyme (YggS family)